VVGKGAAPASSGSVSKHVVLIVAAVASFTMGFLGSSINVAIPTIGNEFSVDAVTLSWIPTSYILVAAMFVIPLGKTADIMGRRKILLAGMAGHTVVSFLCGFSPSVAMLIGLRALQGFTGAMMFGTSTAIVTSVYPPGERGRALGLTVTGVYLGLSAGPFAGGLITHYLGWRYIFFFTAALAAIVTVLILFRMRAEWAEAHGQRLDIIGSIIFGISLLVVMYGFTLLPEINGFVFLVAGVVCLVAFVLWEERTPNPVLDIGLFRHNVVFALSNLSALINYSATFALGFMLSIYLQTVKGFDPQTAGIILLSQPVMMSLFSPLAGRLSDRIEPRVVASAGMGLTTIGLALIAFVDGDSSVPYLVGSLVICGLGFALFSSPNTNAIMSSVDKRFYGVASATTGEMRLVGQMLSMGISAMILAIYVGNEQIAPQNYPAFLSGLRIAFTSFAAMCLVGVFTSLSRGRLRPEAAAPIQRTLQGK
jgi:EmrB/QacA subfamily drug resistance transporter